MKESLKTSLLGRGWRVCPDPFVEAGAHLMNCFVAGSMITIRAVFGDYSGADLVITNMTTMPYGTEGRGYGSQALQEFLAWAKENNLHDIRAVQVQRVSESFWLKNGFVRISEPNPCNDFVYIGS